MRGRAGVLESIPRRSLRVPSVSLGKLLPCWVEPTFTPAPGQEKGKQAGGGGVLIWDQGA